LRAWQSLRGDRGRFGTDGSHEKPLAHLDRARAVLDQIGWKHEPHEVRVDLREHRQALLEALRLEALVVEDLLRDAMRTDAERAERGEPPQRATQARQAAALREFVTSVEAQVSALEIVQTRQSSARWRGPVSR
jgi:hypothetical protein